MEREFTGDFEEVNESTTIYLELMLKLLKKEVGLNMIE